MAGHLRGAGWVFLLGLTAQLVAMEHEGQILGLGAPAQEQSEGAGVFSTGQPTVKGAGRQTTALSAAPAKHTDPQSGPKSVADQDAKMQAAVQAEVENFVQTQSHSKSRPAPSKIQPTAVLKPTGNMQNKDLQRIEDNEKKSVVISQKLVKVVDDVLSSDTEAAVVELGESESDPASDDAQATVRQIEKRLRADKKQVVADKAAVKAVVKARASKIAVEMRAKETHDLQLKKNDQLALNAAKKTASELSPNSDASHATSKAATAAQQSTKVLHTKPTSVKVVPAAAKTTIKSSSKGELRLSLGVIGQSVVPPLLSAAQSEEKLQSMDTKAAQHLASTSGNLALNALGSKEAALHQHDQKLAHSLVKIATAQDKVMKDWSSIRAQTALKQELGEAEANAPSELEAAEASMRKEMQVLHDASHSASLSTAAFDSEVLKEPEVGSSESTAANPKLNDKWKRLVIHSMAHSLQQLKQTAASLEAAEQKDSNVLKAIH